MRRALVVINPIAGKGRARSIGSCIDLAKSVLADHGYDAEVRTTAGPGDAARFSTEGVASKVDLVIAWGGDGTINQVASELVFRDVTLGIVPSGSGNGLSRELGISFDPVAAFHTAFAGRQLLMDAGELDGHLFFNIAGLGLDARVAHEFASNGLIRRGFARYLEIAAHELFTFEPDEHTILADGVATRTRALVIALANGRQYGNGACIAPGARLDDGKLDVVVIAHRSPFHVLLQAPMLFAGRVASLPGVTTTRAAVVEITSARPVVYHVDGEPFVGSASVSARIHPRALRVRVP